MVQASGIAVLAGCASFASAHMFLAHPVRFEMPAATNGPLAADGSNFPCQNAGGGYAGPVNTFPLGSTQELSFQGTAVHGGGSCQLSLTTDTAPTKNSKFRVIHSIQGGCPAKNQAGNLDGQNATKDDDFKYQFPIPADIPKGEYTLAWTWMNRLGNREFYMQCAKVSLTGTGGPQANFDALPEITTANIGNGCTTTETFDYKYYEPGNSVENFNMTELRFPVGSSCLGANGGGSPGGSPGGGYTPPSAPTPTVAPPAESGGGTGGGNDVGNDGSPSSPGDVFITVGTDPAASPTTMTSTTPPPGGPSKPAEGGPSKPAEGGPAPTNTDPGSPSYGNSPDSGAQTVGAKCSSEGVWNCMDTKAFQRCASGKWSTVMQVSAGTRCVKGVSNELKIEAIAVPPASKAKRQSALRFRSHRAHLGHH